MFLSFLPLQVAPEMLFLHGQPVYHATMQEREVISAVLLDATGIPKGLCFRWVTGPVLAPSENGLLFPTASAEWCPALQDAIFRQGAWAIGIYNKRGHRTYGPGM
jgi:hypothetical protein